MHRYSKFSVLALTLAAAGSMAYASTGAMENDTLAIAKAKVSLVQAVSTAEQHAGGKATHAAYENSNQGWVYDVEVVNGVKVFDVRVDADKGTVIASAEDKTEHDDGQDKDD